MRRTLKTRTSGFSLFALVGVGLLVAIIWVLAGARSTSAAPTPKPPRTLGFTSATYNVTEGAAYADVTLTRSATKGKASVTFSTSDGTAVAGTNYSAVTTTVTFPSKHSEATVQVPIRVDGISGQPDLTVTLALSQPSRGWTLATSAATLSIQDMPVPSAPTDLTGSVVTDASTSAHVHLSWTGSATGSVDHYVILSATTSGGSYTSLGTTTETSYDVTPAPTVPTYYVVQAVNAEDATSGYSNETSGLSFAPGSGLYWANFSAGTIGASNPDGTGAYALASGQDEPFGVAVDSSHIYWSDIAAGTIMEANLDGSDVTAIETGQDHPYGVAVTTTYLYWTNLGDQSIHQANLDGSNPTTLIDGTGLYEPVAIAVSSSHIYWGDATGSIMMADLDGSNVTRLVTGQIYPFAIAADSSHLYWANTGDNALATGTIMASDLDGTNVTTLVSGQAHPDGLAVDASHIYWANANTGTIMSADLDGSNVATLVTGQSLPAGVAVSNLR